MIRLAGGPDSANALAAKELQPQSGRMTAGGPMSPVRTISARPCSPAAARLSAPKSPGGDPCLCGTAPAGRRAGKLITDSGPWDHTYQFYHAGGRTVEERNASGRVTRRYVWGTDYVDQLEAVEINADPEDEGEQACETQFWAVRDGNFNVLGLADGGGDLVQRTELTPYGQRRTFVSAGGGDSRMARPSGEPAQVSLGGVPQAYSVCDFNHQGLFGDKEFGLVHNRARYLHPGIGKYTSTDPLGYFDAMNMYLYGLAAPMEDLDPSGLLSWGELAAWAKKRATDPWLLAGGLAGPLIIKPIVENKITEIKSDLVVLNAVVDSDDKVQAVRSAVLGKAVGQVQGNLRFLAGFVEMSAAGEAYRFVSGESVTESIDTYYATSPLPTGFGNIDSFTYHVAREGSAAGTEANIAIVAIVLPFAIKWPGVAPRLVKRPVTAAEAEFESFRALGRGHPEEFLRGEAPMEGGLQTTAHGAERIAGAAATRGGVLNQAEVIAARAGRAMTQADGAAVRVLEATPGRFNVVVEGERGIITTFKNLSQKSLDRLSKNYGWK